MKLDEIVVIGDRVLVSPSKERERSTGGLYLPQGVEKRESVQLGTVIKTGPGYVVPHFSESDEPWERSESQEIRYIPLQVKPGDVAIFLRKDGVAFEYRGEEYLIVPHASILTVIRDTLLTSL